MIVTTHNASEAEKRGAYVIFMKLGVVTGEFESQKRRFYVLKTHFKIHSVSDGLSAFSFFLLKKCKITEWNMMSLV